MISYVRVTVTAVGMVASVLVQFPLPLPSWYPAILAASALLRLLAGLEVLHHQTYPFYYWGRA